MCGCKIKLKLKSYFISDSNFEILTLIGNENLTNLSKDGRTSSSHTDNILVTGYLTKTKRWKE